MLDLGRFPYIDATQAADDSFKIEVDGTVYTVDNNTILRNELGVIEDTTADDIFATLNGLTDPQVFDIDAEGRVISEFKYVAEPADKAAAKTVIDAINALADSDDLATDVPAARALYGTPPAFGTATTDAVKQNLVPASVVAKLVAEENKLANAADANAVATDKAALAVTYNGTDPTITLAGSGANGTTITWASDNAAINATTKAVTRPAFEAGDVKVKLTATITKGSVSDTREFEVTVTKADQTDLSKATEAAKAVAITYADGDSAASVTQNLTLPTAPTPNPHSASVTWKSSNETLIDITTGAVTRPVGEDVEVTLTATVTVGTTGKVVKTFKVVVKGL